MNIQIVFEQMILIFVLMLIGYGFTKKGALGEVTTQQISALIVNICNPALILMSAFDDSSTATNTDVLIMALISIISFSVLIELGQWMGKIVRAPKEQYGFYNMMTIFGNVGFIGIPFVSAVFGSGAVIYAAVYNIFFNLLIYTYGIYVLTKGQNKVETGYAWKKMFNVGTISGIIAIIVFMIKIPVPETIQNGLSYMGRATTFLSMIVLGGSLARMKWKDVFCETRIYPFALIRLLIFPIVTAFILKPIIQNPIIIGTMVMLMAMPVANMPLMLANQYNMETDVLAKGIVLTTILSLVTITVTAMFL